MAVLLVTLDGPMQSWGTRSRFDDRDTETMPSKSGLIGLLCAALGRPRSEPLSDLASLRMAARADRPGVLATDYQTALNVARANGGTPGTVVTRRHYLANAVFVVALDGDHELLVRLDAALRRPKWPLFLGRKSFPPSGRVVGSKALRLGSLEDELRRYPWQGGGARRHGRSPETLEVEWECLPGERGEVRQDVPISFARREFDIRRVRRDWIPRPLGEAEVLQPAGEADAMEGSDVSEPADD